MKHIEQIQPELAAFELDRIVREEGDATASAALTALLHNATGCAIPPTADTPESEVEELVPLCLSILRRHWTTPLTALGDGTTPMSLADLLRRLIGDRVQGNEAWSIPPFNANIPTAVSALLARKIGGVPQAPDGISLVQLLCTTLAANITELQDDNIGWTAEVDKGNTLKSLFPKASKFVLGFGTTKGRLFTGSTVIEQIEMPHYKLQEDGHLLEGDFPLIEDITIPVVQIKSSGNWMQSLLYKNNTTKILRCPNLKYMTNNIGSIGLDNSKLLVYQCNGIEEIYAENLEEFCSNPKGAGGIASEAPNLRKVVVGDIRIWHCQHTNPYFFDNYRSTKYPNLLHLEFKSLNCSLDLTNWTATNVLSLPEFLSNFQTYIADRVADCTGKTALTLTLSAAVYDALQAQEGQTILATLTNKNWTVAQA